MTLVEKLVRCYSPSGHVEHVAQTLLEELSTRGFDAFQDELGNVVGQTGSGPFKLYLIGHMDTVPGEIPVRMDDGKLYGRGSVDAKGCLAGFVEAAKHFAESKELQLTVIGCMDEESESNGARHLLKTLDPPDAIVIGEPSGWDAVTLGYKGGFSLDYALTQPGHHMGADEKTPAEHAIQFYQNLLNSYGKTGTGFEELSINLKEIQTDSDGLHDAIKMNLNIRTPLEFELSEFTRIVDQSKGIAEVFISELTPAVLCDKNNKLVRSFMGAIRSHDGRVRFKRKTGTSDMNLLQEWNCPMLAYGPGDSSLDHTPNEHLKIAEYERAIEILKDTFLNLAESA